MSNSRIEIVTTKDIYKLQEELIIKEIQKILGRTFVTAGFVKE